MLVGVGENKKVKGGKGEGERRGRRCVACGEGRRG